MHAHCFLDLGVDLFYRIMCLHSFYMLPHVSVFIVFLAGDAHQNSRTSDGAILYLVSGPGGCNQHFMWCGGGVHNYVVFGLCPSHEVGRFEVVYNW